MRIGDMRLWNLKKLRDRDTEQHYDVIEDNRTLSYQLLMNN